MKHSLILGGDRLALMLGMDTIKVFPINKGFRTEVLTFIKRHRVEFTPRTHQTFPWLKDRIPEPPIIAVYDVRYKGSWLGGQAVVIARTEGEAIELVRGHKKTIDFQNVTAEIIETNFKTPAVLYNDNGDY